VTTAIRDAKPPEFLVNMLNPIMRGVLRTPLGRVMRLFAMLDFRGRQSGRRYRVPVFWHPVGDEGFVFTPARWQANFAGGASARVLRRGRTETMTGTLVTDPGAVAEAFNAVLATGKKPSQMGLSMPAGHAVTAADVDAVRRSMIRFRP
jgi:hypothetical protein